MPSAVYTKWHQLQVELIIGAGGASVMDCAKLVAFGACHEADWWDYVKGKNPYGLKKLPLILMPTYSSSGSEYGLGAVSVDSQPDDFGTAFGIPADYAVLVPKYSLSLGKELTAYTGLVTLVQLSASVIGDKNPVSYDAGISIIRNVLKAAKQLAVQPDDLDARGIILYGASIATSGRLGIGKAENYSYDIYELEFIPEVLFGASYRKSLTTLFPRFLKEMAAYHEADIRGYFKDAFGYAGDISESADKMTAMFMELGIDMYFDGSADEERIREKQIGFCRACYGCADDNGYQPSVLYLCLQNLSDWTEKESRYISDLYGIGTRGDETACEKYFNLTQRKPCHFRV